MGKYIRLIYLVCFANLAIVNVQAQGLLPESISSFLDEWQGATVTERVTGFVRLGLTLAFGAVILVAVLYSILAAIKYIRSQGDSGKVEEANESIKAIFQGIAAMFIGFVGIIIVFFIFDVALPDPSLPTVCVKCPDSDVCTVCSEGDFDDAGYPVYKGTQHQVDCNPDDSTMDEPGFCNSLEDLL